MTGKKLVICFDGTWSTPDNDNDGVIEETNVARIYRSILGKDTVGITSQPQSTQPEVETIKWYDPGVGTDWLDRVRGGAFGFGLSRNIRQGYKFLVDNYSGLEDEIYLFGFSRGAYTARSLAGLIRNVGVIKHEHISDEDPESDPVITEAYEIYRARDVGPDSSYAKRFREDFSFDKVKIKFLGVWDTVGALGIPLSIARRFNMQHYAFHDTKLSKMVENAYHALAIDEHRDDYRPTMWSPRWPVNGHRKMEQVWFAGAHSDVGGGSQVSALSDLALNWMKGKALLEGNGLEFDANPTIMLNEDYVHAEVSDSYDNFLFGAFKWLNDRHYRPIGDTTFGNESIHDSVGNRVFQNDEYKPKNPGLWNRIFE